MATFIWIALGLLGLLVGGFLFMWRKAILASRRRNAKLLEELMPILEAVEANEDGAAELVLAGAQNPATRNYLYALLQDMERAELFPAEFRTIEKHAESDLVTWLMHPNELNAIPAEIQIAQRVAVEENGVKGTRFLFRFLTDSSHPGWERGWMAGISGVYWDGAEFDEGVRGTFSEFTPFNDMTEEEHVEFLTASRKKKGLVVPS